MVALYGVSRAVELVVIRYIRIVGYPIRERRTIWQRRKRTQGLNIGGKGRKFGKKQIARAPTLKENKRTDYIPTNTTTTPIRTTASDRPMFQFLKLQKVTK